MKLEVELKAPAPRGIEKKLLAIGAKKLDRLMIRDDYYDKPGEPLRKKKVTLRIRTQGNQKFLTYKNPRRSKKAKIMEETELAVTPSMDLLLRGLGYTITLTMKKRRTTYALGKVIISVDQVTQLGKWIEFEVFGDPENARKKILAAAGKLGIAEKDMTNKAYPPLLREKLKKRKRKK